MKKIAIIVAGGAGTRMNEKMPKQFIEINGKPVIIYCFDAFYNYDRSIKFIVSLHPDYFSHLEKIIGRYPEYSDIKVVKGGETRFHSVKNAVSIIKDEALVAIHDAVRPLLSIETINRCFDTASADGCAVPCLEICESLRQITTTGSMPVDRNKIRIIQTPQVFRSDILLKAYRQSYSWQFTDDSTVVENAGYKISLTEGSRDNIKITTKEDLIYAESLLAHRTYSDG
jgi:2-C-methyl-D-erythritol 4-phosphate cytidylyltransferase